MRQRSRSVLSVVVALGVALGVTPAARSDRSESSVRGFQHGLVSIGTSHTCGVLVTAKLRCWGVGGAGALGLDSAENVGDTAGSMQAAGDTILPADVLSVDAGDKHTCAVLVGGRVRCWGYNFDGQLGNDSTSIVGTTAGSMAAAADVPLPAAATAVTAGNSHTCALLVTGAVRCWGQGAVGQLGNGGTARVGDAPGGMAAATDVVLPRAATAISASYDTSCALLVDGAVRCWGEGGSGQLGTNDTADIGDAPGEMEALHDIPLPGPAVAVSAGSGFTCALLATGKVRCWGYNFLGSLGIDTSTNVGDNDTTHAMSTAADAILPANAISISAGSGHACAVLVTAKLRCWGAGMRGQLGNGATVDVGNGPTEMESASDVPLPDDVVTAVAGSTNSCALMTTGKLRCWGQGDYGHLGTDTTNYVGDNTTTHAVATAPNVILPADLHVRVADLSVSASAAPAMTSAGGTTTVTVSLTNAGPDTVDGVVVAAPAPDGTVGGTAAPSVGTYDAGTQRWTVGALAVGAVATLQLTVTTPTGGTHSGTYEVLAASRFDPDSTPAGGTAAEDDRAVVSVATAAPPAPTPTPTPTPTATPISRPDVTAPVIRTATLTRRTFARRAGRLRRPTSTRLTVSLSEPAGILITAERLVVGRRSGSRCVALTPANRRARACTRALRTSRRTLAAAGTTVRVTLDRRIGGSAAKPGRYRLTLRATDAAGNTSRPRTITLTLT